MQLIVYSLEFKNVFSNISLNEYVTTDGVHKIII